MLDHQPSQVKDWQAKVENTDTHIVYKSEVTKRTTAQDPIEQEMVGKSWNVEQLRNLNNLNKKINRQQRLTWDEIYNVHEMALDMENVVHHITAFPNMVIICGLGLKQALEETELVLRDGGIDQLLSYDTTGDFNVSILIFRHILGDFRFQYEIEYENYFSILLCTLHIITIHTHFIP